VPPWFAPVEKDGNIRRQRSAPADRPPTMEADRDYRLDLRSQPYGNGHSFDRLWEAVSP
jgi:hypothetical protein